MSAFLVWACCFAAFLLVSSTSCLCCFSLTFPFLVYLNLCVFPFSFVSLSFTHCVLAPPFPSLHVVSVFFVYLDFGCLPCWIDLWLYLIIVIELCQLCLRRHKPCRAFHTVTMLLLCWLENDCNFHFCCSCFVCRSFILKMNFFRSKSKRTCNTIFCDAFSQHEQSLNYKLRGFIILKPPDWLETSLCLQLDTLMFIYSLHKWLYKVIRWSNCVKRKV